jgi:hypothetical protein
LGGDKSSQKVKRIKKLQRINIRLPRRLLAKIFGADSREGGSLGFSSFTGFVSIVRATP